MNAERRRQGRAIRKRRREVAAAIASVDWAQMQAGFDALSTVSLEIGRVAEAVAATITSFVDSMVEAVMEIGAMVESYNRKVDRAENLVNQDC